MMFNVEPLAFHIILDEADKIQNKLEYFPVQIQGHWFIFDI